MSYAGALLTVVCLAASTFPLALRTALVILLAVDVGAMALHGSRSDLFIWHRHYIPSYVVSAVFVGDGLEAIARRVPRHFAWLALVIPATLIAKSWQELDRSQYRIDDDSAVPCSSRCPPAHTSPPPTTTSSSRSSISISSRVCVRTWVSCFTELGKAHLPPLTFDPARSQPFFTHHPNWNLAELDVVPVGLVLKMWRRGDAWPEPSIPRRE